MKYSTVSIIAAALASVCSATDLPAKFGLSIAPPAGSSALNSLAAEVVAETFYGASLRLTKPGETNGQVPVIFTGTNGVASLLQPSYGRPNGFFLAMKNQPSGSSIFISTVSDAAEGGYTTTGLSSVDGSLVWDLKDGKGPQSLWKACVIQGQWGLNWNVGNQPGRDCYKIDLKVSEV